MISIQGGEFVPIPFDRMFDPATGHARVRLVDIGSTRYRIARRYMLRLRRDDFDESHELAKIAKVTGLSVEAFRREFAYLIDAEPPQLRLDLRRGFVLDEEAPVGPEAGPDQQPL